MRMRFSAQLQQGAKQRRHVARPVSDAPRTHCTMATPGLGWSGKRSTSSSKSFRVGLDPVVEERGAEAVDGRALEAEVGVPPLVLVAGVADPLVGDADAARESGRFVDDHTLRCVRWLTSRARTGAAAGTIGRDAGVASIVASALFDRVRPNASRAPAPARRRGPRRQPVGELGPMRPSQ